MAETHKRNNMLMIEGMIVVLLLIFIGAFTLDRFLPTKAVPGGGGDTPPIVGFVPVEIKSQQISINAAESIRYILFTEREGQFNLTSLRLSGEVIGNGRAEIVLDNGLGQELLIYSNIKQKQGNMITGMAVDGDANRLPDDVKVDEVTQPWLIISSGESTKETPEKQLTEDRETVSGKFQTACTDTCYMNMKMQKDLYYSLKIRVDAGTEIRITDLKYTLEV
jgi:hypothetical protein